MATLIKPTRPLRGKEAQAFARRISNPKPVSRADYERAQKSHQEVVRKHKNWL